MKSLHEEARKNAIIVDFVDSKHSVMSVNASDAKPPLSKKSSLAKQRTLPRVPKALEQEKKHKENPPLQKQVSFREMLNKISNEINHRRSVKEIVSLPKLKAKSKNS